MGQFTLDVNLLLYHKQTKMSYEGVTIFSFPSLFNISLGLSHALKTVGAHQGLIIFVDGTEHKLFMYSGQRGLIFIRYYVHNLPTSHSTDNPQITNL